MPKPCWVCEHCGRGFASEEACAAHEAEAHKSRSVEERLRALEDEVWRLRRSRSPFRVGNQPQWLPQGPQPFGPGNRQ